jgi:ABC-type glycerol-3-phosphate transport system substrate-binding protein
VIWFPHTSANGQTYSAEQARKEGEVILYSTITVGAFDQLSKALKEKYPFITVRHIRLGPAQQLARIMQEQRSGQFPADVVYNSLLHLIYLKESGFWKNASPKPEDFKDRPLRDDELKT